MKDDETQESTDQEEQSVDSHLQTPLPDQPVPLDQSQLPEQFQYEYDQS